MEGRRCTINKFFLFRYTFWTRFFQTEGSLDIYLIAIVNNKEESVQLPYTVSKMSPLSNSVYSSVFTYNPNVLTRTRHHQGFDRAPSPHTCFT